MDDDESTCSSDSIDSIEQSPLTIATNAGATLTEPTKAVIARKRKVQKNPAGLKLTSIHNMYISNY